MQGALSYHITYIFSVTLEAFSETIPPFWSNVNIDYLPAFQILVCALL